MIALAWPLAGLSDEAKRLRSYGLCSDSDFALAGDHVLVEDPRYNYNGL